MYLPSDQFSFFFILFSLYFLFVKGTVQIYKKVFKKQNDNPVLSENVKGLSSEQKTKEHQARHKFLVSHANSQGNWQIIVHYY